jgi:hypothetical protein
MLQLWQWEYTDEFGKRRVTRWRMDEATVKQFAHVYKDAAKVEGSLEIRGKLGSTSDFLRSMLTSTPGTTTNAPGNSSDSDTSRD